MPEYYADWWWEDLPEKAKKAAVALGYSQHTWDDDADIPYDRKPFAECTLIEKRAARMLGMDPIAAKLDLWWDDVDPETQEKAKAVGWTKETWDDDWEIWDLPIEDIYWNDLNEEQKDGAMHFGYTRSTWDETDELEDIGEVPAAAHSTPAAPKPHQSKPPVKKNDEKKDEQDEEVSASQQSQQQKPQSTTAAPKKNFVVSGPFGGDGGSEYGHGHHRSIKEITLRDDGHAIHQLKVTYFGDRTMTAGAEHGKEHTYTIGDDEYIVSATVRSNRLVQSLAFKTNKGRTLGPCGGEGWKLPMKDSKGDQETVNAPDGYQLCGFNGRCGRYLDQITFHWGPLPDSN